MSKWYEKKRYLVPISIIASAFGIAWVGSLLGEKSEPEFNPDYYKKKEAPIFIKK
ncbi:MULTISPECIES: hypothetical protein [Vagococcus]|uniref:Uncharacterized protein n=1 Tax=Vagococcus fluvialis bH819 TaxID=1255619 RepID=A0A1X6WRH8_9ENTE|nr:MULTISPECIES: hypothetical protein [Vagococcus]SLM86943.1 hypothetical protein FM121_12675 [Vagococcus fluvialis bH819]